MSSGDKILSVIRQESEEKIAVITADADKVYTEMTQEAKKQAEEIRHGGEHKIELQAENLLKAYKSKAELERRNAVLKAKRNEIEKAIRHIHDYMLALEDKKYFELVMKFASSLAEKNGTVYFNSRDLKRLPKDIVKKFSDCGVKVQVAEKPCDDIDGGFILRNGDIEENMSFSSILIEKREELEDMISRELFKD